MNYKPILFSAPMVLAILNGRKTVTRRVLSPRNTLCDGRSWTKQGPQWNNCDFDNAWIDAGPSAAGNLGPYLKVTEDGGIVHRVYSKIEVGNTLWVRENLHKGANNEVVYSADSSVYPDAEWIWKRNNIPSIHCPRGFSRITIEVTGVKVERLQDISEDDAISEGMEFDELNEAWQDYNKEIEERVWLDTAKESFATFWELINGPGSWEENPWCAAYEFEEVKL